MDKLLEGVQFGNKEIQTVKDNANLFQVGIEYEFHPNEGYTQFKNIVNVELVDDLFELIDLNMIDGVLDVVDTVEDIDDYIAVYDLSDYDVVGERIYYNSSTNSAAYMTDPSEAMSLEEMIDNGMEGNELIKFVEEQSINTTYYAPEASEIKYIGNTIPNKINDLLERVHPEHDNQFEMITKILPLDVGLNHIKETFKYIKEYGYTTERSGIHVSISLVNNKDSVDMVKFAILSELGYIAQEFKERKYVTSLYNKMKEKVESNIIVPHFLNLYNNIEVVLDKDYLNDSINDIASGLYNNTSIFKKDKEQSIKFSDYIGMDGRIELRYMGGDGYENEYDKIEWHIYRALYNLYVASTNDYDKEYKLALYKMVMDIFKESEDSSNLYKAIVKFRKVVNSKSVSGSQQLLRELERLSNSKYAIVIKAMIEYLKDGF